MGAPALDAGRPPADQARGTARTHGAHPRSTSLRHDAGDERAPQASRVTCGARRVCDTDGGVVTASRDFILLAQRGAARAGRDAHSPSWTPRLKTAAAARRPLRD